MSYLQHYEKGKEADNHSYTKREWINGKWVYYYGDGGMNSSFNRQNNSYKDAKIKGDMTDFKIKQAQRQAINKVRQDMDNNKKKVENQATSVKTNFKGAIQKGKDKINSILNKLKGNIKNVRNNGKVNEDLSRQWRDAAKKYNSQKKLKNGRNK